MPTCRLALSVVLLSGFSAALAACGSDDSPSIPTPSVDAGRPDATTTTTTPPADSGVAQAAAAVVNVYFPAAVTLDASGSTGPGALVFAWEMLTPAAGSALTTASLAGAKTATPSFTPDRIGTYVLRLTVTGGAATSTLNVDANVIDPPVFYIRTEDDGGAVKTASFNVVGAAFGNGGSAVSCFSSDAGTFAPLAARMASIGADFWEGPPGAPSRIAYVFDTRADGGIDTTLLASTSTSTCATPPVKLDTLGTGNPLTSRALEQPRFSPNGTRVAYVRSAPGGATISTIGFDGAARRDVAPYYAGADGDASPGTSTGSGTVTVRPVWTNDTTVSWVQSVTGSTWQIVSAADVAASPAAVVMTCTGTLPNQFEALPNGEFLVSQRSGNESTPANLIIYSVDATRACTNPRDLTKLVTNGSAQYARDFALSPDRVRIAFASLTDAGAGQMRVVSLDGGAILTAPVLGAQRGPRWVGGGAFLSWGVSANAFDAGSGNVIATIRPDGTGLRAAVTTPPNATTESVGNGVCSIGRAGGSGVMLFGMFGLLVLRIVRRRRAA